MLPCIEMPCKHAIIAIAAADSRNTGLPTALVTKLHVLHPCQEAAVQDSVMQLLST